MAKIGFKVLAFIAVVFAIFWFGFIVGGGFGSGMALEQFERCLPADTLEDLEPCASGSGS